MIRRTLAASVIAAVAFPVFAAKLIPPSGWRFPTEKDVLDDWKHFDSPYRVEADFNGDGHRDSAWILLGKKPEDWAVFVFMGRKDTTPRVVKMLGNDEGMPAQRFAITLAPPSNKKWKTACGKGYGECKPGEPEEFQITLPSIQFCYIESACSIYMWNKKSNSFEEIRFSD